MNALLIIGAVWLTIGAVSVYVLHRRGHDVFAWAIPFLFLGPFALPVAISAERHHPDEPDRPFPPGGLDVLALCDGSEDCAAALDLALTVLGDRPTSVTLAAVVDFEAATTVRGRETKAAAEERLDAAAAALRTRTDQPVGTVVLFGEPKQALQHYAATHGYELVVTGRHLFGGRTNGRANGSADHAVPMLIGPGPGRS